MPSAVCINIAGESWRNPNQSPASKMLSIPPMMAFHAERDPPGTLRTVAGEVPCACVGKTCGLAFNLNRTITPSGTCVPIAEGGTVPDPPWVNFSSGRSLVYSKSRSGTIGSTVEPRRVLFYGLPPDHAAWPNCTEPSASYGRVPDAGLSTDEDPIRRTASEPSALSERDVSRGNDAPHQPKSS